MLTLGTAMATSGAAVSPNMGRATTAALGFVLTVFNVRLARWMPNPRREKWRQAGPGFGLVCLLQELFGFSNERRTFVHHLGGLRPRRAAGRRRVAAEGLAACKRPG